MLSALYTMPFFTWGIQTFPITLYRNGGMNQREIGELMSVDYSVVSVMRRRLWHFRRITELSVRIERLRKRV